MKLKSIQSLSTVDFSYELPHEKIAYKPIEPRDTSKLLVYRNGIIEDSNYMNLAEHLPSDSLLIGNNTKVVEARLLFKKETGGQIELFCLEPDSIYTDITKAMASIGSVRWKCLVGGAKKWKNERLSIPKKDVTLNVQKIDNKQNPMVVEFSWDSEASFAEILHMFGNIPLPPYIKRSAENRDKTSYQTVYAKSDGSVAAPTAGLHFSNRLFQSLSAKGISTKYLILHVGAGTFMPVKSESLQGHEMHSEFIDVSIELIDELIEHRGNKISIGTTSLRTLESLYWMGVKCSKNPNISLNEIEIKQWEPYELPEDISAQTAFLNLIIWMKKNGLERLICKTQLLIAPGYQFKTIDGLITNFHQPQSTLLLLVAALVGDDWKKIYQHALQHNYRFLSFGDGSLLWKK